MRGSADTAAVLANVMNDPCVPIPVQSAFFAPLSGRAFASPEDAWRAAEQVVWDHTAQLTLSGRVVSPPGFARLFRMVDWKALDYMVRPILDRSGHTLGTLQALSCEECVVVLGDILFDVAADPVSLGNRYGIVWATDEAEVAAAMAADALDVYDRLGLEPLLPGDIRIICAYERNLLAGSLHVPRCLDAISLKLFVVGTDCGAETGMTKPVHALPERGFREIVHRAATVTNTQFSVIANVP